MFFNIFRMVRKMKQKMLYDQIFEFLESKHCTGSKSLHKDWLLELVCHTKAKDVRGITYRDLMDFSNYVFNREASEFRRNEAIKILRKFYKYCIVMRYCSRIPDNESANELKQPTEDDIMALMSKVVFSKPGPMPDVALVRKIRNLRNSHGLSFRQIVKRLEEETGKRHYVASVFRLYNNVKVN